MNQVFAFEVSVVGTDWHQLVNHTTPGKAKYDYWLSVRESWPDVPFTAIRCRKISNLPESTAAFIDVATHRGLPDVRCGQRVRVGDSLGVIVGHNASANFDVLFDEDAPRDAGMVLNVHPASCVMLTA